MERRQNWSKFRRTFNEKDRNVVGQWSVVTPKIVEQETEKHRKLRHHESKSETTAFKKKGRQPQHCFISMKLKQVQVVDQTRPTWNVTFIQQIRKTSRNQRFPWTEFGIILRPKAERFSHLAACETVFLL